MRLGFVIPWHELGPWVWEFLSPPHEGFLLRAAPDHTEAGPGTTRMPPYVAELVHLLRRRVRLTDLDVVFTWELRCALATVVLRRLQRADRTRLVAVGPILKGAPARIPGVVARLLGDARTIVCFSTAECDAYARDLRLPRDRFRFWPTPWRTDEPISDLDEGFVLALGRSNRDLPTLFEAMRGTDLPLTVVAGSPGDFRGAPPPPGTRCLFSTGYAETNSLVRGASLHAVPLFDTGFSSGQTVLLRAMAVGKACVVSDVAGIRDYVRHGETALVVPPADPGSLRDALTGLWRDPERRRILGVAAAATVRAEFGLPVFCRRVVALAQEMAS